MVILSFGQDSIYCLNQLNYCHGETMDELTEVAPRVAREEYIDEGLYVYLTYWLDLWMRQVEGWEMFEGVSNLSWHDCVLKNFDLVASKLLRLKVCLNLQMM